MTKKWVSINRPLQPLKYAPSGSKETAPVRLHALLLENLLDLPIVLLSPWLAPSLLLHSLQCLARGLVLPVLRMLMGVHLWLGVHCRKTTSVKHRFLEVHE